MASVQELRAAAGEAEAATANVQELRALASKPPKFSETALGRRALMRLTGEGDDPLALSRAANIAGLSIMGASAGARTPILPGPAGIVVNPITGALAGGAAGAALGTFAPETGMELAESMGMIPEGTRDRKGLSNEELRAIAEAEALIDLTMGGTMQALSQVGRAGVRGVTGVSGDLADRVATGVRPGEEIADTAARMGVEVPAFMAGQGKVGRGFVSIFGRLPLVGGPFSKAGQKAAQQTEKAVRDLPSRIAPIISETDLGRHIYRNARTMVKMVGRKFNRQYEGLFEAAEQAGVKVVPRNLIAKAEDIVNRIDARTPIPMEGVSNPGPVLKKIREFVVNDILPLKGDMGGATAYRNQTLRQMDGLIEKLDQELASLEPGQRRFATSLLAQIKTAAQADVYMNATGSPEIARALRELDGEFSRTMSQLFETATAQRFGTVRQRGLRGQSVMEATRTPVDQLAKTVVSLDSPQAIEELSRIVSQKTMQRIASRSLKTAFDDAYYATESGLAFRPSVAAKKLGLGMESSGNGIRFFVDEKGRAEAMSKLLEKSGSGLTLKDIETVLNVAEQISRTAIPDINTFIARSLALRIGSQGKGAIDSLVKNAVGSFMFLFGGRAISRVLSDPLAARSLKGVLSRTATRANRKVNYLRAVKAIGTGLLEEGEITPADAVEAMRRARDVVGKMTDG